MLSLESRLISLAYICNYTFFRMGSHTISSISYRNRDLTIDIIIFYETYLPLKTTIFIPNNYMGVGRWRLKTLK